MRVRAVSCVLLSVLSWASAALGQLPAVDTEERDSKNAALEAFAGQQIVAEPRIECDTKLCDEGDRRQVLIDLVAIKAGSPLVPAAVIAASDRLKQTGYFESVTWQTAEVDGGIELAFVCVGQVIITDIDVEYTGAGSFFPKLFAREISKRLPYRKGGRFPPASADGLLSESARRELSQYVKQVVNLYHRRGYEGTKIQMFPEYYGPGFKQVRITVRVTEGQQPEIGQVLLKGNSAFGHARILSHISTGEHVDLLRSWLGSLGVARYDRRKLKDELTKIETEYREDGYVRARVRLDPNLVRENGQVYPRIRIFEGPHLETLFKGNRRLDDKALREVLTFKESAAFDATEIEASRQAIIAAYQAVAHYNVEVEAKYYPDTRQFRDPDQKGRFHQVVFEIQEGSRVYIQRVEITGNKHISTTDLLERMESKGIAEDGVIWGLSASSGVVQPAQIINDLLSIRRLYADRGMTNMTFWCGDKWSRQPARDHCYTVRKSDDPRLVTLHIKLNEGTQTLVDKLSFTDNFLRRLDEDTLDQANATFRELGFKDERDRWVQTGFTRRKVDAVKGFVLNCLYRDGYLQASVTPRCPLPDAPDTECTDERLINRNNSLPRIIFEINRGRQTRARGILLRGLLRTDPAILENELLFAEGDALGSDEIFNSQASIRSLGIFETVNIQLIKGALTVGQEDVENATVLVTVEESSAASLDLGGGFRFEQDESDENTFIVDTAMNIKDKNVFGRALEMGLRAEYANAPKSFFNDLEVDQANTKITPYLVNRRFMGSRLAWDLSLKFDQGLTGQRDEFLRNWGVETNFSYDFFNLSRPAEWGRGLFARLGLDYGYQKSRPVRSESASQASYGDYKHSLTLSVPFTWERRDNPIHPTRGFWVELRPELVFLRPAVFSAEDIGRQLPKKITVSGQGVFSFFDKRFILVPFLRLGAAFIDDEDDEPKPDFFFKAGGDGVTHPIRGYDAASVEACNGNDSNTGICRGVYPVGVTADDQVLSPETIGGRALLLGSVEGRVPLDQATGLWLAGYLDFGAVGKDWGAINEALFSVVSDDEAAQAAESTADGDVLEAGTQIRASTGVGIRWLIGGIIPLRLDVAYPLSATVFSDQTWRFHFNIGYPL